MRASMWTGIFLNIKYIFRNRLFFFISIFNILLLWAPWSFRAHGSERYINTESRFFIWATALYFYFYRFFFSIFRIGKSIATHKFSLNCVTICKIISHQSQEENRNFKRSTNRMKMSSFDEIWVGLNMNSCVLIFTPFAFLLCVVCCLSSY